VSTTSVRAAWFEAALDLRIRIQEPNPLEGVPNDAARVIYVPDFGGRRGAVVFAQDFTARPLEHFDTKALKEAGYFYSIVSLQGYSCYKREHFVETLLDWGYFGPEEKCPEWYREEVGKQTKNSEPGGPAHRSQPVGSETNQTSSAAGSGG
jgi:hypothetical protein